MVLLCCVRGKPLYWAQAGEGPHTTDLQLTCLGRGKPPQLTVYQGPEFLTWACVVSWRAAKMKRVFEWDWESKTLAAMKVLVHKLLFASACFSLCITAGKHLWCHLPSSPRSAKPAGLGGVLQRVAQPNWWYSLRSNKRSRPGRDTSGSLRTQQQQQTVARFQTSARRLSRPNHAQQLLPSHKDREGGDGRRAAPVWPVAGQDVCKPWQDLLGCLQRTLMRGGGQSLGCCPGDNT